MHAAGFDRRATVAPEEVRYFDEVPASGFDPRNLRHNDEGRLEPRVHRAIVFVNGHCLPLSLPVPLPAKHMHARTPSG